MAAIPDVITIAIGWGFSEDGLSPDSNMDKMSEPDWSLLFGFIQKVMVWLVGCSYRAAHVIPDIDSNGQTTSN